MRKIRIVLLAVFLCFRFYTSVAQDRVQPEQQLFYYGQFAIISIDKQLYLSDTSDYFYIHVSIKNISRNALGIDLSNPWYVLYPNQWQFSDTTFRMDINESQIIPEELTAKKAEEFASKIRDHKLTMVLPGNAFDYYTEFNAEKPKAEEIAKYKYLIVAIDGQMFFTDGTNIEHVKCNGDLNVDRELALKCPFTWQQISEKQKIRHRK
ncbi:MAG TPA: hypothetical protein PKI01_06025 [Bacteroidales bacterium]|nr:hypothetical protein [Bacteroidales bacterium]